jgi:hypothetical protein
VGVAEVGEPLDLGRHVGEVLELGGGQQPVAGRDLGRKLVGVLIPTEAATFNEMMSPLITR